MKRAAAPDICVSTRFLPISAYNKYLFLLFIDNKHLLPKISIFYLTHFNNHYLPIFAYNKYLLLSIIYNKYLLPKINTYYLL